MSAVKCSVYIATSLDGFIARDDGSLDWLPGADGQSSGQDQEEYGFSDFMASVDALVMGRNTYDKVLSFGAWPYGDKKVIVLSHRDVAMPASQGATVVSRSCTPAELVAELEAEGTRHLYIDGGRTIQEFLRAGLIQDITITRIPVLIGSGIPLFGPTERDIALEHVTTRVHDNGFVQQTYRVRE